MRYLVLVVFLLSGCAAPLHQDIKSIVASSPVLSAAGISEQDAERIMEQSLRWGVSTIAPVKGEKLKLSQVDPQSWGAYAFLLQPNWNERYWDVIWGASQNRDFFQATAAPYRFSDFSGSHNAIHLTFTYNSPSLKFGGMSSDSAVWYKDQGFILRRDKNTGRFVAHRDYVYINLQTSGSQRQRMQKAASEIYVQVTDDNGTLLLRSLDGKQLIGISKVGDGALEVAVPVGKLKNMRIPVLTKLDADESRAFAVAMNSLEDSQWQKQKAINEEAKRREARSDAFRSGLYSAMQATNESLAVSSAQTQAEFRETLTRASQSQAPGETSAGTMPQGTDTTASSSAEGKRWTLYMRCAYIDTKTGAGGTEAPTTTGSTVYLSRVATFHVSTPSFTAEANEAVRSNFVTDMRRIVPDAVRGKELCESNVKSAGALADWSPVRPNHRKTPVDIMPRQ